MMKRRTLCTACGFLAAFLVWTAAVCFVDVRAIGPQGSEVGLAGLNQWVHQLTGVHMTLYTITDWLGLVPIALPWPLLCWGCSSGSGGRASGR